MTVSSATAPSSDILIGDIRVHRIGLGTMQLTGPGAWGEPDDPRGSHRAAASRV
jgi:pyridoxine 4-dehydrogenase